MTGAIDKEWVSRPPKAAGERKVNQTLRLDADVLDAYRHLGDGLPIGKEAAP